MMSDLFVAIGLELESIELDPQITKINDFCSLGWVGKGERA